MRPASLGLVVDLSGSMRHKIAKVQAAVEALLQNLEPEDEEFLVTFADRPELRLPFTSDISAIRAALSFVEPHGWTALFLISDGGDNYSRLTRRELRGLLDEEDVQIHAIGIHDLAASREEVGSPWIFEELAKMTGRSTPYY